MKRNTVFSQLMQLICQYRFKKCVDRYDGNRYSKRFSCWQQLLVLLFAQAKGLTSLRDIEISLRSHHRKWYHLGLTSVARSTLADANTNRDADILKEVFYSLLEKCRDLAPRHRFKFKNPLYSFDSTLINVCLSLYPWATYRKKKGAFKLHTLFDHSGYLPSFVVLTDGRTHGHQHHERQFVWCSGTVTGQHPVNRPGIHRLQNAVFTDKTQALLCHKDEKEHEIHRSRTAGTPGKKRRCRRLPGAPCKLLSEPVLPVTTSPCDCCRSRIRGTRHLHDQQLRARCHHHRGAVQISVAD